MEAKQPTPELRKALENLEVFKKLVREKLTGPENKKRAYGLGLLIESAETDLICAPASTRTEYQGAFAGGLVDHSLKVVKNMVALNKAYEAGLTSEEIVVTGLFHDIGKIGTLDKTYYLIKNSDWHNRQGIMFEINPELANIPVSLRSLFLLQRFEVQLSENEHMAIASIKDRARPGDDSLPVANEPMLAVILQQAVKVAALRGKGRTSLLAQE